MRFMYNTEEIKLAKSDTGLFSVCVIIMSLKQVSNPAYRSD